MAKRLDITGYPYPGCPQIIVPFGGYERLREIVDRNLRGKSISRKTKFKLTCSKCGEIAKYDSLEDLPNHSILGACGLNPIEAIKINEPEDGDEWRYVRFAKHRELFVHSPVKIVFEDYSDPLDSMKPRPFAKESMEIINWIQKHLKGRWAYEQIEHPYPKLDLGALTTSTVFEPSKLSLLFYFEDPNDAMLLKLVHS